MLRIPFGRASNGRLVDVHMVSRGLACGCHCPGCGAPLLAKKGEVLSPHFAHAAGADCAGGAETALHLAAKQVLLDAMQIRLPALTVEVSRNDPVCGLYSASRTYHEPKEWYFDIVEAEAVVGSLRPDITGMVNGVRCAVEIHVTHAVDAFKQEALRRAELPCIEVHLADLLGQVWSLEQLAQQVVERLDNKSWAFHPLRLRWEAELLEGFGTWRTQRLAQVAQRTSPLRPRQQPAPVQSKEDRIAVSNARYKALSLEQKWRLLERDLGVERSSFPTHLTLPEPSVPVILVEGRLWQAAVFARFIATTSDRDNTDARVPSPHWLAAWVDDRFGVRDANLQQAEKAVVQYLGHLAHLGFIRHESDGWHVAHGGPEIPAPRRTTPVTEMVDAALPWKSVWPDRERMYQWAKEFGRAFQWQAFKSQDFVDRLLRTAQPLGEDALCELVQRFGGDPDGALELAAEIGLMRHSRRLFSFGQPAPWMSTGEDW